MWPIVNEDPHGIVQEVQPVGGVFWDVPQIAAYHKKFNLGVEGCRYNARQKSRRWAVLGVLLIVGTFC